MPNNIELDWRPSADLISLIQRTTGAEPDFIEDSLPEFILYWQGQPYKRNFVADSKFLQHISRQWKYASYKQAPEPMPMVANWEPDAQTINELASLGYSPQDWQQQLPEFRAYWTELRELRNTWNATFIQHVQRRLQPADKMHTRDLTMEQLLSDDWATEPDYTSAEASKKRLKDVDW